MHSVNGVVMLKKLSDILSDKASLGLGTNLANIFARQSVPRASALWGL